MDRVTNRNTTYIVLIFTYLSTLCKQESVLIMAKPVARKRLFGVLAVALASLHASIQANEESSSSFKNVVKSFDSAGVTVFQIPNFLPKEVAEKWRNRLREEWLIQQETCPTNHTQWTYATNANGSNSKERSLENVSKRREMALELKEFNKFAYAKWELEHGDLFHEMEEYFLRPETIKQVEGILLDQGIQVSLLPQLSDFFVTQYSSGDFLSKHNDYYAGSWAFVISLMDSPEEDTVWQDHFGGQLRFECPFSSTAKGQSESTTGSSNDNPEDSFWCSSIAPTFNAALIFQTGRYRNLTRGPYHEVLRVAEAAEAAGFRRFGLTGWYVDKEDRHSQSLLNKKT